MRKPLFALFGALLWLLPALAWAQSPVPPYTYDYAPGHNFFDYVAGPTALSAPGTVTVPTNGAGSVAIQATGTGAGLTFNAQGTVDGVNYFTLLLTVPSTCATSTSGAANGNWVVPAAGYKFVQVNLTGISSGTETFTLEAGQGAFSACQGTVTVSNQPLAAAAALGDAAANPTTSTVGSDNSLWNAAGSQWNRQQSAIGAPGVAAVNVEGTKVSYSVGSGVTLAGATIQDACYLAGSATKTIRVNRVAVSSSATTASQFSWMVVKRSSANSGCGASTTPPPVPHDSADAAASAVFTSCSNSAAETPGASVGSVRTATVPVIGGTNEAAALTEWRFGTENAKSIVLRGVAQNLSVTGNGNAVQAGQVMSCDFEWTEE